MKVHPKYCNGHLKKVRRCFTVFVSLILNLQKTGKQEFQLNSVKAKVYSERFQQTVAKILPLNFSYFFFPCEIAFPKNIFTGPGKKLGQFFMNKKVCILTNGKIG